MPTLTYDELLARAQQEVERLLTLRSTMEINDSLLWIRDAIGSARNLVTDEAVREYVLTAGRPSGEMGEPQ